LRRRDPSGPDHALELIESR